MRVYRVENEYGQGPYTSWPQHGHRMAYAHTDHKGDKRRHPGPYDSFGESPQHGEKFAFPNMHALFRWFGGWLPLVIRAGYHVTVFDVPEGNYWADEFQVMYTPREEIA